jgi:hypothetical protein
VTTISLYVCAPAGQNSDGTCTTGQGAWENVVLAEPFDVSQLNTTEIGLAYGAGFTVMSGLLLIAWSFRAVIKPLD